MEPTCLHWYELRPEQAGVSNDDFRKFMHDSKSHFVLKRKETSSYIRNGLLCFVGGNMCYFPFLKETLNKCTKLGLRS